ncbi:phage integrase N-terminal SAM-like domain-containing protein [Clostridium saudiense]|nr:phage integrase N-terminal SAM-like domain-containing protein [Clostridium saudiense]
MPRINKKSKKIEEIIQNYIDYCNYKNLRPKTIKSYYQTLMLFAKYLEEELEITDIKKVNKKIVEDYLAK